MKWAFLYAGQGSQKVGMGKDFYETYPSYKEYIDSLDVGIDIKKLMHEGPLEELTDTKNTQACMAAFAAGVTDILIKEGITPSYAMGLSLGEYGALYAAGAFDNTEYVKLTAFRGAAMQKAAEGKSCKMSAVLGLDSDVIKEVCDSYSGDGYVTVSNYNCKGQTVICGDEQAVNNVEEILKEKGAKRCIKLNVSGPFHTKYMASAGDALKEYFEAHPFKSLSIPVMSNATGDFYKAEDSINELLIKQVQSSVRLEENIEKLLDEDIDCFIEIGPGKVVSGFMNKMSKALSKEIKIMSIETVEDFKKVLEQNQ